MTPHFPALAEVNAASIKVTEFDPSTTTASEPVAVNVPPVDVIFPVE